MREFLKQLAAGWRAHREYRQKQREAFEALAGKASRLRGAEELTVALHTSDPDRSHPGGDGEMKLEMRPLTPEGAARIRARFMGLAEYAAEAAEVSGASYARLHDGEVLARGVPQGEADQVAERVFRESGMTQEKEE